MEDNVLKPHQPAEEQEQRLKPEGWNERERKDD
jgi:hypothetical protein